MPSLLTITLYRLKAMLINTKIVVIIHNKAIKSSFCSGGAATIQTIMQINSNIVPPIAVPTNTDGYVATISLIFSFSSISCPP